ncbi:LCP family protein [Tomitella biformata]|uniref:LCP family protein n=1 Tax=Tomitella biformata TaxID=630403 RepID=UPI0004644522|nr:LCP family protein [Tomitella biformata]
MTDDHRTPTPWERPLSKIRDETPTDEPTAASTPRSRRRRSEAAGTGVGERLTVAELLQRVGLPDDQPTRSHAADEASTPEQPATPDAPAPVSPAPTPPAPTPPAPPRAVWLNQGVADQASAGAPPPPSKAGPEKVTGSEDPPARPRLSAQKKVQRGGMILVALVSILAVTMTGLVWGYLRLADGAYTQIAALDQNSDDVRDAAGQYGDETYLIVGTDSRAGANGEMGAGTTEQAGGARSDTVIVVNIPADRSRVVAVSFPRDLNVNRPSCFAWDNELGDYTKDLLSSETDVKLNSVYQDGGPKCLVKVIQKMSGLQINHFVGMDFAGFEQMVNTIGGVEVCTTEPLVDEELGTVLGDTGTQTISGSTALDYVRARKVESEGNGDYGRIKRQQVFLSSLLRTALSNKVLFDPGKLNGFINEFTSSSFGDNLDTQALITLGRSLQRVEAGKVTFLTVPTAGTNDWGNEIPRSSDISSIFDSIIDDKPLPGEQADTPAESQDESAPEAAADAVQVHAVSPYSVSVQVSNASGFDGVATAAADKLGSYGVQIYNIGNYSTPVTSTIVQFSGDNEAEAATIASMIPGAKLQRTTGLGNFVEVVLGSDYNGLVVAPADPGDVLSPVLESDTEAGSSIPLDVSITNAADVTCA